MQQPLSGTPKEQAGPSSKQSPTLLAAQPVEPDKDVHSEPPPRVTKCVKGPLRRQSRLGLHPVGAAASGGTRQAATLVPLAETWAGSPAQFPAAGDASGPGMEVEAAAPARPTVTKGDLETEAPAAAGGLVQLNEAQLGNAAQQVSSEEEGKTRFKAVFEGLGLSLSPGTQLVFEETDDWLDGLFVIKRQQQQAEAAGPAADAPTGAVAAGALALAPNAQPEHVHPGLQQPPRRPSQQRQQQQQAEPADPAADAPTGAVAGVAVAPAQNDQSGHVQPRLQPPPLPPQHQQQVEPAGPAADVSTGAVAGGRLEPAQNAPPEHVQPGPQQPHVPPGQQQQQAEPAGPAVDAGRGNPAPAVATRMGSQPWLGGLYRSAGRTEIPRMKWCNLTDAQRSGIMRIAGLADAPAAVQHVVEPALTFYEQLRSRPALTPLHRAAVIAHFMRQPASAAQAATLQLDSALAWLLAPCPLLDALARVQAALPEGDAEGLALLANFEQLWVRQQENVRNEIYDWVVAADEAGITCEELGGMVSVAGRLAGVPQQQ
ncbi:hypothetical protein N2152v2_003308 [Parachlorella kessleri]